MPPVEKIVCAVDFSEPSERAAAYAVALARRLGASVHFVHAWDVPVYALPGGAVILGPEVVAKIENETARNMDALLARHRGEVPVAGHVVHGTPAREIVRMAGELGAALVVVGTHGRTGLSHLWFGSVAERVVRTSPVPVLTVPPARGGAGDASPR